MNKRTNRLFVAFVLVLLGAAAFYQPVGRAEPTQTTLGAIPVSASTGEKPQSKVWFHDSTWWAVLPTDAATPGAGTWVWRLEDGGSWTAVLHISNANDTQADVKSVGTVAHVLLYGAAPELVSLEFVPAGSHRARTSLWPSRPTPTSLLALSGSETATIDIDSTGRMWLATRVRHGCARLLLRLALLDFL